MDLDHVSAGKSTYGLKAFPPSGGVFIINLISPLAFGVVMIRVIVCLFLHDTLHF